MIKDQIGPKAVFGQLGLEKRINHADPVIEHIGQGYCRQIAGAVIRRGGVFDHPAFDRGFLDHRGEFENIHIGHAAICVAMFQIPAKQIVLILGRPGGHGVTL